MNAWVVALAGFVMGAVSIGVLSWYLRHRAMRKLLDKTSLACHETVQSVRETVDRLERIRWPSER